MSCRIMGLVGLFAVAAAAAVRGEPLPGTVDLGPEFQKFGLTALQQGDRGDCSLFAVTALAEFELAKSAPDDIHRLSEEFLIWAAHAAAATEANDQAMFYQALHGLNTDGICLSRLMPYASTPDARRKPSKEALVDARTRSERWKIHWIKRWDANTGLHPGELAEIKQALAHGHPVACGLRWPKKLDGHEILRVPPSRAVEDGHSIAFTGYREDASEPGGGVLYFKNSFGPNWGNHGYGVMSYAYAAAYANDAVWVQLGSPHSEKPRVRLEAESLPVLAHGQCDCSRQEMKDWGRGMWSHGEQLFCPARNGGFVTLGFNVDRAGKYRVRVLATAAPDYGRIHMALDGRAVGSAFDLFCGRVSPSGSLELARTSWPPGSTRFALPRPAKTQPRRATRSASMPSTFSMSEPRGETEMDEQKRAGGAYWCVVALTLPILYVLSLGPSCWVSSRLGGAKVVTIVYRPVTWAAELTGSDFVMQGLQKYSRLGTRENHEYWCWTFSPEIPGNAYWSIVYLDVMPSELLTPPGPASP